MNRIKLRHQNLSFLINIHKQIEHNLNYKSIYQQSTFPPNGTNSAGGNRVRQEGFQSWVDFHDVSEIEGK